MGSAITDKSNTTSVSDTQQGENTLTNTTGSQGQILPKNTKRETEV